MHQDATWCGGRPQPRRLCVIYGDSAPVPTKGVEPPPQFSANFYGGQTAGCINMPLGIEVGLRPGDFVLDGYVVPTSQKGSGARGRSPHFSAHVYCGQTSGWIKMVLIMEVGLGPVHIVLDGDTDPLEKKGDRASQFSAHLYCGQTAGCIKMPLDMEVGLGLRDIVFDVDPATPSKKGTATPPNFWPMSCGQVAVWMKTPLGAEVDLGPGDIVLNGVPAPAKGAQQPPSFRPMSIVATVAHLSYC